MKIKKAILAGCLMIAVSLCGCAEAGTKEPSLSETAETTVWVLDVSEEEEKSDHETTKEINQKATLLFGGDILLTNHVLTAYEQSGGISGVLDEQYLNEIEQADYFVANEEFPFSDRGTAAPDKQFTFRLLPEQVHIFQEIKLDLVSLANNHALDFGREALIDTINTLDQAGISHIGAGNNLDQAKAPVIEEIEGIKVGFLGATRVIPVPEWAATANYPGMLSTYDPATLIEAIKELKAQCDYVVVYVHWGIEREEKPEDYQQTLGQQYIDAGADLVVGSHPHVLQGVEFYKGKPIVYSLGNFIFGSSIKRTTLLKVELCREDQEINTTLKMIPGTSSQGFTKTIEEGQAADEFYQYMTGISDGISFSGTGSQREILLLEP